MASMRDHWPKAIIVGCIALALGHLMPPLPADSLQSCFSALLNTNWKSLSSDVMVMINEKRKTVNHDDVMEFWTTLCVLALCYFISFVCVILTFAQLALV